MTVKGKRADATIEIDLGKKCSKCGAAGATPGSLCLKCAGKRIGAQGGASKELARQVTDNRLKGKGVENQSVRRGQIIHWRPEL